MMNRLKSSSRALDRHGKGHTAHAAGRDRLQVFAHGVVDVHHVKRLLPVASNAAWSAGHFSRGHLQRGAECHALPTADSGPRHRYRRRKA